MNFLAHLFLAGKDPEFLVGNLMGDFVKGRPEGRFPPGIARGVMMHRRIDSFTDNNERFRISRDRLAPSFGLYRGVLVDLFYDHFLADEWGNYASIPLSLFLEESCSQVRAHETVLPERLQSFYPIIFSDLIPTYAHVAGIDRALERMSARLKRENPLALGGKELRRHYLSLRADFRVFFPQVQSFAQSLLTTPI